MIDDKIEDGLSEADAVAALGSVDQIAAQTLSGVSLPKLVKNKSKSFFNRTRNYTAYLSFPYMDSIACGRNVPVPVGIFNPMDFGYIPLRHSYLLCRGAIGCIAAGIAFLLIIK